MLSEDFKELLLLFNEYRVKYLIVGGYAVAVHAQPRATKDLDLFVKADPENAKAVHVALAKFGAPLEGIKPEDFINPGLFFRMGTAPQMVEIFSRISGVDFDAAWERRTEEVMDDRTGLKVFVISAEDFIANKIAAGRPQDVADVDAVRKAAASQRPETAKKKPPAAGSGPNQ
ncbi:MAG: nucleotidyl transferase AbiEii/AbiGii toxin family protein [Bryobacteraceae bacterium]